MRGVSFRRFPRVAHRNAAFQRVQLGDLDRQRREIDSDDLCAALRHRFAQQAAAAAHIEHALALERGAAVHIVKTNRIQRMQRPELSLGIPPALRYGVEAGEFGRIVIRRRVVVGRLAIGRGGARHEALRLPEMRSCQPAARRSTSSRSRCVSSASRTSARPATHTSLT